MPWRFLIGLTWLLLLAGWSPLASQSRHSRTFGAAEGLVPAFVVSLAQDSAGLLWIGTAGGLYRYDGITMRHWAPDSLRSWVSALSVSPDGMLVALEESRGSVYEIARNDARPVAGPGGGPLVGVVSLTFDGSGGLWAASREQLLYRDPSNGWTSYSRDRFDGAPLRRVVPSPSGGVLVLTLAGVWRATGDGPPQLVSAIRSPVDALTAPDGRLFVATFDGRVAVLEAGLPRELVAYPNRAISLALRNNTLWIAYDHHLAVLEPGRGPEVLGAEDLLPSGGPMLVDHEGSLWVGTSGGLVHFPEPDTRIWDERHGLPSRHTRYVARTGDTLWVNTWRGSAAIGLGKNRWRAWAPADWSGTSRLFVGGEGELWTASVQPTSGLFEVYDGEVHRRYTPAVNLLGYASGPDGSVWLATNGGLLVASAAHQPLRRFRGLPFESDSAIVHAILFDRTGRAWVASDARVCHASGLRALERDRPQWTCDQIPSGRHLTAMMELPSGAIWATLARGGVWRYVAGGWEPVPGTRHLPALDMHGMVPARDSGVWIIGIGTVARVIEDPSGPDGWRVLEQIAAWHGLHSDGNGDLLEEADGTLWLATSGGVVRIPTGARRERPAPPRVVLGEALVDGEPIPLESALELPHHRNRLELRFAAISFRDPSLLRYEVRISPDGPWERVQGEPAFRWLDLPAGNYRAEVRASLDGVGWTSRPARFEFRVLRPWYLTPWALAAFALGAIALLTALYRARVAFLLELERQRTRIAMDLHDEMGSGLGSIGILSSMLSSGRLEPGQNSQLAGEIVRTAGELGTALSGIVWSLTPRAGTIEEMAGRLAEHGRRLFADGTVEFVTVFPDPWPEARLHPSVRRNALLIMLEALHNAARHSAARRVSLGIKYDHTVWTFAVEDDGLGLSEATTGPHGGMGLDSMRQRAAEIGASLLWARVPAGGTSVALRFDSRPRMTRWKRWFAGRTAGKTDSPLT